MSGRSRARESGVMTENAFTRRDNDNGDSNGEDGGRAWDG